MYVTFKSVDVDVINALIIECRGHARACLSLINIVTAEVSCIDSMMAWIQPGLWCAALKWFIRVA